MGVIPATKLQDLRVALSAAFSAGVPTLAPESIEARLRTDVRASTGTITYQILEAWPKIRKWIGDRQYKSLREKAYQLSDEEYEATLAVRRRDIQDDNLGTYIAMVRGWGAATDQFFSENIYATLVAGTTGLCYDGLPFFSASHPYGDDGETATGTQSNYTSAGGKSPWFLLDLTQPLHPIIVQERQGFNFVAMDTETDENVFTKKEYRYGIDARYGFGYGYWQQAFCSKAEVNQTNFLDARDKMEALVDDKGRKLGVSPNVLLYGASNEVDVRKLFEREFNDDGTNNIMYQYPIERIRSKWL